MGKIELTAETLEYEDTCGDGPTLVLLGGVLMPGSVWDPVTELLAPEHRCIVVDMPLGGHRIPLKPDAGLKLRSPGSRVWTPGERIRTPDHGRRLAEILSNSELLEIPESRTLIMRDQPKKFADAIRKFVADA